MYSVSNKFLLLQSIGLPLGFRSAPLCFIYTVVDKSSLPVFAKAVHTELFKLDLQGNVQCSVTCLRTFLQRISLMVIQSTVGLFSLNYYVPHKTAVLLGFFFFPLVKGNQNSDIFHIIKIHCLLFMLPEVFQI